MLNHVYTTIEVARSSGGIEQTIRGRVAKVAESVRNINPSQVCSIHGNIEDSDRGARSGDGQDQVPAQAAMRPCLVS